MSIVDNIIGIIKGKKKEEVLPETDVESKNIVYKYLPPERLTYLHDELLRITQPSALNDPFEFLSVPRTDDEFAHAYKKAYDEALLKINKSKVSEIEKSKQREAASISFHRVMINLLNKREYGHKRQSPEEIRENLDKTVGILSLSRRWDSTLMWSHYASSHQGFCVGFNFQAPFFSERMQDKTLVSVKYSDSRVPMAATELEVFDLWCTKSTKWQYEAEERIGVLLTEANQKIECIPLDIYLYTVPHFLVKEIIVGLNISTNNFILVKEFCAKNEISLYQTKASNIRFDMNREKCN